MVNALISVVAYDSCLFLPISLEEEEVSNDKGTSLGLGDFLHCHRFSSGSLHWQPS